MELGRPRTDSEEPSSLPDPQQNSLSEQQQVISAQAESLCSLQDLA